MVHPIPKDKQMELPSVTKKKADLWKEVDTLYNEAYALLAYAVKFVEVIVSKNYVKLEHIDAVKLTNMVSNLDKDVAVKRQELNKIYTDITAKKQNEKLSEEDVFMMRLLLTSDLEQWTESYQNIIQNDIKDISDYISQGGVNSNVLPEVE